jgi:hypothetical protein
MNVNKQILMMTAAVVIAATTIFAGCKKDDDKVKVTGVELCSNAVMLPVDGSANFRVYITPSNADNRSVTWTSDKPNIASVDENGKVTSHAIGEATITCTTNDGGHTAQTTVIVNPARNEDDYATLVPAFYWGDLTMDDESVGTHKLITVKYDSKNKVNLSIDEKFIVPQMGNVELPMQVTCPDADVTKVENGYNVEGTTSLTIAGLNMPVTIDGVFSFGTAYNLMLDMNIYVELPVAMGGGNIIVNFKGKGETGACMVEFEN